MTTASAQPVEVASGEPVEVVRNVGLDHIGFVEELDRRFVRPLRDKVKAALTAKGAVRGAGDYFTGLIAGVGKSTGRIDPEKFLRLYEKKKISRAQLVAAIRVGNEAASECLSQAEIDKISDFTPATPRLCVERIKTVELPLVNCVKGLGEIIS